MEFDLKWVHMGRYELILKLDGALWLPIIFKPLLTPKGVQNDKQIPKSLKVHAKPAKRHVTQSQHHFVRIAEFNFVAARIFLDAATIPKAQQS